MHCTQRAHAPRRVSSSATAASSSAKSSAGRSNSTSSRGSPPRLWPSVMDRSPGGTRGDVKLVGGAHGQHHPRRRTGPGHPVRRSGDAAAVHGAVGQCDCQRTGFGQFDARRTGQPRGQQIGFGNRARDRVTGRAPQHDCGFGRAGAQIRGRRQPAQTGLFEVLPRGLVEHLRQPTLPDAGSAARPPMSSTRLRRSLRSSSVSAANTPPARTLIGVSRSSRKRSSQPHSPCDDAAQHLVRPTAQGEHRRVQPCRPPTTAAGCLLVQRNPSDRPPGPPNPARSGCPGP